jgi:hypothetical protein
MKNISKRKGGNKAINEELVLVNVKDASRELGMTYINN